MPISQDLIWSLDNTYDLGTSGARPRNVYAGTQVIAPNGTTAAPSLRFAEANTGIHFDGTSAVVLGRFGSDALGARYYGSFIGAVLPIGGSLGWQNSSTLGGSTDPDLALFRDAANTLAQRNATNAQTLRLYNTYTDASNYERLALVWSGNFAYVGTEAAGTGTQRGLVLKSDGGIYFNKATGGTQWQFTSLGHFIAAGDNTYDIGASGASRPRYVYVASGVQAPGVFLNTVGAQVQLMGGAGVPAAGIGNNGDFFFRNDTPATANQRLYVKSAGAWVGIV
jgi:hypothetical protein